MTDCFFYARAMLSPYHLVDTKALIDSQHIPYPDKIALESATDKLRSQSPLVTIDNIHSLSLLLKKSKTQPVFFIHAGDCAEKFSDLSFIKTQKKVNFLYELCQYVNDKTGFETIPIGRIAGQFAKPRSSLIDRKGDIRLTSYRGDLINAREFEQQARMPCPKRLLTGYELAKISHNAIHELKQQQNHPFFTSHEALNLHYDCALTRKTNTQKAYNLSTHLPWLGMRTAHVDSIHLNYLSQISNPVAVKIGAGMQTSLLKYLMESLNPYKEEGKLILIPRLGINKVKNLLPLFIEFTKKLNIPHLWFCDPMHGNTISMSNGQKTRRYDDILKEMQLTFDIHKALNSKVHGLHLELTHSQVSECQDSSFLDQSHASLRSYESALDPRLNQRQSKALIHQLSICL